MSKKKKPASNIVVGGVGVSSTATPARNRRVLILGAAVCIGLILAAGILYGVKKHNDASKNTAPTSHAFTSTEDIYTSESQKLDAELAAAKTPEQKSAIAIKRANAALVAGKFSDAVVWGKKAVEAKATVESYSMLGSAAVQANDKPTAVDAYKKAAALERQKGGENSEQIALRLEASAAVLP